MEDQKPLVSIIILAYNSREHLPGLFASLQQQTYSALEIIVVDNASVDDTVDWVKNNAQYDLLIENPKNEWFSKGNNIAVRKAKGEYILFCNDDIVLTDDCIEKLVEECISDRSIGMVGVKLLKLQDHFKFDSAGIELHKNFQAVNRGENEEDIQQYDTAEDVFGITGALMMVSREALDKTRYNDEFFDEDFVAYKEDVDLSWRMHQSGYRVRYYPDAVAYHARTIQKTDLQQRSTQSPIIRGYSYRNHWWMLIKNMTAGDFVRSAWRFLPYELVKFAYICIIEWPTLRYVPQLLKGLVIMRRKRSVINNMSIWKWIK